MFCVCARVASRVAVASEYVCPGAVSMYTAQGAKSQFVCDSGRGFCAHSDRNSVLLRTNPFEIPYLEAET
eukprot:4375354-Prymnesium_polylepis.1